MKSITEIAEELQVEFSQLELFDVDSFNGHPALVYYGQTSSLFIYNEDDTVKVFIEDDNNDETYENDLVDEDDILDLYQEIANVIYWVIKTKIISEDVKEYKTLLRSLKESNIEPDKTFQP